MSNITIVPLTEASAKDINDFLLQNQFNKHYENMYLNNWFQEIKKSEDIGNWINTSMCYYHNNILIGWVFISIDRPTNIINIDNLCVIDKKLALPIFKNIIKWIKKRATKRVPKITFGTMTKSVAEPVWHNAIKRYNGRVVGIQKNHYLDQSESYRDRISFEIDNPIFKG
ncbi:MAG: hypothetical protein PHI02_06340 [Sulfurovaceae bacterium]|nr:hypothetical protein [Sulfurovaceae bacterium]